MIKQKYTGQVIGGIIDSTSRAAIILNGIMLISNLLILYSTTVTKYTPWISFTVYAVFLSIIIILILYLAFRYVLPSAYGFFNHQVWNYDNPMVRAIFAIFNFFGIPETKDMLEIEGTVGYKSNNKTETQLDRIERKLDEHISKG